MRMAYACAGTGRDAVDAGGAVVLAGAAAVAVDAFRDCVVGCESRKRHDVQIESADWSAGLVRCAVLDCIDTVRILDGEANRLADLCPALILIIVLWKWLQ